MELLPLTRKQIKEVYRSCLLKDFPPMEVKPLISILRALDAGTYECLGFWDGDTLLGYAFFVKHNRDYLLDYFAIVKKLRNQGIGSALLGALSHSLQDADSVIAEVEDPECTELPEEKAIRLRRLRFYLHNGFSDCGVTVNTFGVNYRLLEMSPVPRNADIIRDLYSSHYRAMLPEKVFQKMVKIYAGNP